MQKFLPAVLLMLVSTWLFAADPSPAPSPDSDADAGSTKIYKWVDEKGQTHYADRPRAEGDAPVDLPTLQVMDSMEIPSSGGTNAADTTATPATETTQATEPPPVQDQDQDEAKSP